MKQLTFWQGIGLLMVALHLGLMGRFWLEAMVFNSPLTLGGYALVLVGMTAAKQPKIQWLLGVYLLIGVFLWVSNFTIGVVF